MWVLKTSLLLAFLFIIVRPGAPSRVCATTGRCRLLSPTGWRGCTRVRQHNGTTALRSSRGVRFRPKRWCECSKVQSFEIPDEGSEEEQERTDFWRQCWCGIWWRLQLLVHYWHHCVVFMCDLPKQLVPSFPCLDLRGVVQEKIAKVNKRSSHAVLSIRGLPRVKIDKFSN